jgi:tyrosyl-tRNA synthetase
LVHSPEERDAAVAAAAALFGRSDLRELPEDVLAEVTAELGAVELVVEGSLPSVVEVLERSGVVPSKGAARRAIAEGGAYLNNAKVGDVDAMLTEADLLHGRFVVTRRGKRTVGAVVLRRAA